ncbi:unnamed protein product [Schistosoma turkestanicum]|nr:unnamed protein product [Schistosoma turkestanicum]
MNLGSSSNKVVGDLKSIDEYEEYRRIVGEDDGGKLFTPEQYEAYKKKYIPLRHRNRIFVSWTNPNGVDCILPGPQSECFCQHRYETSKWIECNLFAFLLSHFCSLSHSSEES